MAALGWLLNLDFAGGGSAAAPTPGGPIQRAAYLHRRRRPYAVSMFKRLVHAA